MVPQLDTSYWSSQIVWLVICLVILVLLFKKIFLPKITSSVSTRDKYIRNIEETIKNLTKLYEKLAKDMKDIDERKINETRRILNEAKIKCEHVLDEQLRILDLKSKTTILETRKNADDVLKNLDRTIKTEIESASQQIFDKLFGDK